MKEIIEREENRTLDNFNKAYVYKDKNSGWYRAYEWSAYLLEFYPNNLDEKGRLKPTHKKNKTIDKEIIYVGLQLNSFDKFLPSAQTIMVEEDYIEVTVDLSKYYTIIKFDNYKNDLLDWKSSVPIKSQDTEKQQSTIKTNIVYNNPITFVSIMKDIITYDTYGKSEEHLRNYIHELKEKCINILC